jgi:hypothetical protein
MGAGDPVSVGATTDARATSLTTERMGVDGSITGVPVGSNWTGEADGETGGLAVCEGVALVPGELSGVASDDGCTGEAGMDGGDAVEDGLAGGTTRRGVSVGPGVAIAIEAGEVDIPEGDASATGEAATVAWRSAALWVNTLGAMVTTNSLGRELDRVSTTASKRLASTAPAAMSAFVRFNESSRSRNRRLPSLGIWGGARMPPAGIDSRAGADFTLAESKRAVGMTVNA